MYVRAVQTLFDKAKFIDSNCCHDCVLYEMSDGHTYTHFQNTDYKLDNTTSNNKRKYYLHFICQTTKEPLDSQISIIHFLASYFPTPLRVFSYINPDNDHKRLILSLNP